MNREQLRKKIAEAKDRTSEKIPAGTIEGWDFDVWITKLSGKDGNELAAKFTDTKAAAGEGQANVAFTDLLLVRSLTDEAGGRLYEDTEIELITAKGTDSIKLLTQTALKLNKLDKVSQDLAVKPSVDAQTS